MSTYAVNASTIPIVDEEAISFDKNAFILSVTIILAVFIVVSTVGNCLVCFVFYRQPSLRKPSFYPILSLAIADLLSATLAMPAYVAKKYATGDWKERAVCDVFRFSYFFTMYASVLSLTVISLERFTAIKMPMRHRTWLTSRKMTTALALAWIDAAVVSALPFVWRKKAEPEELCTYSPTKTWSVMVIVTNVFIPFVIMSFCHFYTVSFAVTYTRQKRDSIPSSKTREHMLRHTVGRTFQNPAALKKDRDITCTLAVVVGVFVLCWGPSSFYYFIQMVCAECYRPAFQRVRPIFNAVVKMMTFASACVNPLIYCWLNQSMRNAFFRSLLRKSEARRKRFSEFTKITATALMLCEIHGSTSNTSKSLKIPETQNTNLV